MKTIGNMLFEANVLRSTGAACTQDACIQVKAQAFPKSEGHIATLLLETEPLRLLSTMGHQETQLIGSDSPVVQSNNSGGTLVQSDDEGSGDTVILSNDHEDCRQDLQRCFPRNGLSVSRQDCEITSALAPVVDASDEKDMAEDKERVVKTDCLIGCMKDIKPVEVQKPLEALEIVLSEAGDKNKESPCSLQTPEAILVQGGMNAANLPTMSGSDSRRRSISSVRAETLRAAGLRAAARKSIGTKYESDLTGKSTHMYTKSASEKHGKLADGNILLGTRKESLCSKQAAVNHMISDHSPCMSTSRSRSKSIASVHTASLPSQGMCVTAENVEIGMKDLEDSDTTIELTPETMDSLPQYCKVLQKMKSGVMIRENISTSVESLTPGLGKSVSHTSYPNADASVLYKVRGDDSGGKKLKSQGEFRHQFSGQKVRKLFMESKETISGTDAEQPIHFGKKGGGDGAVLEMRGGSSSLGNAPEVLKNAAHKSLTLSDEHKLLPSGLVMGSANLSCPDSQEPGEDSQLNALNVVDKLVWMDTTCMSQDTGPVTTPAHDFLKDAQGAKGIQSLAHSVEMKALRVKMDVYDWVDSQQDEPSLLSELKEVSGPPLSLKRVDIKSRKLTKGIKKQAECESDRIAACPRNSGRGKPIAASKKVMNAPSNGKLNLTLGEEPHIVLTTRLRNRTEIERVHPKKKTPRSRNLFKKGGKKEPDKAGVDLEYLDGTTRCNLEGGLYQENGKSHKDDTQIGSDTQAAIEAMDMMRHVIFVSKSDENGVVDADFGQNQRSAKPTKSRKRKVFEDDGQEAKRCKTSSEAARSTRKNKGSFVNENLVKGGPRTRSKTQAMASGLAETTRKPSTRWTKRKSVHSNFVQVDLLPSSHLLSAEGVGLGTMKRHMALAGKEEEKQEVDGALTVNILPRHLATTDNRKRKRKHFETQPLTQRRDSEKKSSGESLNISNDVLSMVISRKTRSSLCKEGTKPLNREAAEGHANLPSNGSHKVEGLLTRSRSLHQKEDIDSTSQLTPLARKVKSRKENPLEKSKALASSKVLPHIGYNDERRRKKRGPGDIRVLLSHSLPEEMAKHQKKILAKLGACLVMSVADCTHFVTNCFVRTRNMLESIAGGKQIVTPLWLDSCGQACYFVDETNYILRDLKKEKELGFSMHTSLLAAQQKLLLKGMKVFVTPSVNPDVAALTAIIKSAGGEVVRKKSSFLELDLTGDDPPFVVASEEDYKFCLPFLERGFKIYSTELILRGIIIQFLDFSRNRLFEKHK